MTTHEVLRRLLQKSETAEADQSGALSPARVFRTGVARAADVDAGLALTVLDVRDEKLSLTDLLPQIEDTSLIYSLARGGDTVGFAAIDMETRAVLVEQQMTGHLREAAAAERVFSASDVELCRPMIDGALREIRCLAEVPPLAGWTTGVSTGLRLPDRRAVGLVLDEAVYRFVHATIDFGVGDRKGTLILCLPYHRDRATVERRANRHGAEFERQLKDAVLEAPAVLHAVLHRLSLPLDQVEGFQPGDVVSLPGVTVNSVRFEGPDGKPVAAARLGQVTGLRAVRLELPVARDMDEVKLVDTRGAHQVPEPQVLDAEAHPDPAPPVPSAPN